MAESAEPIEVWLERVCGRVPGTHEALILGRPGREGPLKPLCARPSDQPAEADLVVAAQMAATTGRPVMRAAENGAGRATIGVAISLPMAASSGVALSLSARPEAELARALVTLRELAASYGSESAFPVAAPLASASAPSAGAAGARSTPGPLASEPSAPPPARAGSLAQETLELVATCLDHEHFRAAATAVVTALATRHRCERVSIGFLEGDQVRVGALSHSAQFDERSQLVRDIAAAMEEALDQECAVVAPAPRGEPELVRRAHEALRAHGAGALCTVPIAAHGEMLGAVTFEAPANGRLDPRLAATVRPVVDLIGPILDGKRLEERSIGAKALDAARDALAVLRDPAHPGRRVALGSALGVLLFISVVPAPYRVAAPARVEGTVQRAVVAPADGFLTESRARAGDLVRAGQVLGALDHAELALERRKWLAQREQHARGLRAAMAERDSPRISVLRAQVDQAEAEVALNEELLKRTELAAPFDGIVAKGDWSQSLGSPVERGQVLFEVAPLDDYRVVLEVDERAIDDAAEGQRGKLTLSALPSESLPFVIERVTPVATAEDGRNFFRVEARIEGDVAKLRPGMEGVGKIDAGWRRILWIWTHSLFDWLRLWLWARLP